MPAVISLEPLTRRFGQLTAVDDLSLEFAAGEVFGLLGSNEAGKTTTLNVMCGLLPPTSGRVRIQGLDPRQNARQVRAMRCSVGCGAPTRLAVSAEPYVPPSQEEDGAQGKVLIGLATFEAVGIDARCHDPTKDENLAAEPLTSPVATTFR